MSYSKQLAKKLTAQKWTVALPWITSSLRLVVAACRSIRAKAVVKRHFFADGWPRRDAATRSFVTLWLSDEIKTAINSGDYSMGVPVLY